MTADQQRQLDLIEKDRRERERELLLLFLLLSDTARSYSMYALKLGHDPVAAIRSVFLGNPDLDLRGGIDGTAFAMQEAYKGANDTASEIVGVEAKIVTPPRYTDAAREAIDRMIRPLASKIRQAQDKARAQGLGAKATAKAVGEVFGKIGFTKDDPFLLDAVGVSLINSGFQNGLYRGFKNADVRGLEFSAIKDERTTEICWVRDGVKLLIDDPYWETNTPSLHYFCRSTLFAIFGKFEPTINPPTYPPPQPGFGMATRSSITI